MFGKNQVRPIEHDLSGARLRIHSIFHTIQGEGPLAGLPCVFIRLAGCNLRCHFCDTAFDEHWEHPQTIEHILKNVSTVAGKNQGARKLVVITGGEPLLQNITPLIGELLSSGTEIVQIETAGTVWPESLTKAEEENGWIADCRLLIVCSPKTPKVHPMIEQFCDDWKYVISKQNIGVGDGLPVQSTQDPQLSANLFRPKMDDEWRSHTIWLSPTDQQDPELNAANLKAVVWSSLEFGHRMGVQLHKIAGLE